ncbi:hypothetical protein [Streptomyces sp. NBC_00388]|uniref:hypothetical protein n=1 Tax=Streptomyces sp. NBC_00388 TaxID=2975735 RepID=UPI002E1B92A0
MSFSVWFLPAATSDAPRFPSAGQESSDDYETLVIEACGVLSETRGAIFRISGFGCDEWPLDVAYDLSTFMEQFPGLLAAIRERREIEVDLYGQGVERALAFRPVDAGVVITCDSRTDWVPDPDFERVGHDELVAMLVKLAADFAGGLSATNCALAEVAPFASWLEGRA